MRKFLASLALIGGLAFQANANAAGILYWTDFDLGTNNMAAALSAGGYTFTTATGEADFVTQVGAGGWDAVVFMNQNSSNDAAQGAISTWVGGGGKAIYADWTRDNTVAAFFDAAFTGNVNDTQVTVNGGLTNPVVLANAGWGIFSTGLSVLAGGVSGGTFGNGDVAIVIGNDGNSIINGFLADSFADSAEGTQLYLDQLSALLDAQAVPEPGSLLLVGLALLAFAGSRRKA